MENLGEIALQKNLDRNTDYESSENKKEYFAIDDEIESVAGDFLEKEVDEFKPIDQKISDILFLDDKKNDLEQSLESIESNEIYYLRLKSKINSLKHKIEDLRIKEAVSDKDNLKKIYRKIQHFSVSLEEYETEFQNAKEIMTRYPSEIEALTKELELYDNFLNTYDEQQDRFNEN
tara:strand:+ start:394 stop:921 length:528 start_codon:yes stop_codon:yes gene_type:complete